MGFTNYVIKLAADDIRPLLLGLQASLCAPPVVMALLGGWPLCVSPFEALFGLVAVAGVVSMVQVRRLAPPAQARDRMR